MIIKDHVIHIRDSVSVETGLMTLKDLLKKLAVKLLILKKIMKQLTFIPFGLNVSLLLTNHL